MPAREINPFTALTRIRYQLSGHNDRRAITASGHDNALDRSAIGAGVACLGCLEEFKVATPSKLNVYGSARYAQKLSPVYMGDMLEVYNDISSSKNEDLIC